jgi:hypothetical protein
MEQLVLGRARLDHLCAKPDDLGDPHFDQASIGSRGHGELPPSPLKAILLPEHLGGER